MKNDISIFTRNIYINALKKIKEIGGIPVNNITLESYSHFLSFKLNINMKSRIIRNEEIKPHFIY